ncbi:MAG: low specificity L-threonine aldolase, partial [Bacteroidales bacterium]|nr:low specificity L-threonine aldolase [Bacteroidales bacterium]
YPPFIPSPTNQQFFRLPNEVIDSLSDAFTFEYWGPRGETISDIRIVTSWATRPSDVDAFISRIQSL